MANEQKKKRSGFQFRVQHVRTVISVYKQ